MELWGLIPYSSGLNGTQKDIYAQKQIYLRLRDVEVAGSNPVISTKRGDSLKAIPSFAQDSIGFEPLAVREADSNHLRATTAYHSRA